MKHFIFVGERQSELAVIKQWTWTDGRLAAKQLFDALEANLIDPAKQRFCNLWTDPQAKAVSPDIIQKLRMLDAGTWLPENKRWTVVGLGLKVQAELRKAGIRHIPLTHPAARGLVRRKHIYAERVATALFHTRPT